MRRVAIDANVWVSARIHPNSIPGQVIQIVREQAIASILSSAVLDQVIRALVKLRMSEARITATLADCVELSEFVEPTFRLSVITAKESDNRVLECAVAGQADFIVTGDQKHLLRLGQYEGIPIISPCEFVDTSGSLNAT